MQPFHTTPGYAQVVVSYLYQLFFSLMNHSTVSFTAQDFDAQIFSAAVRYMMDHLCEQPDVGEIAKMCEVSVSRLKRIFALYAGFGVHKYFTIMRINTAIQLLSDGLSVTTIAEQLGFSSQGYFSMVFKRETGMWPTEYR